MSEILTDSIQDYLKVIYELTEQGEPASTTALAGRLGVAPASVTGMLQKLSTVSPALVTYQKHQGATLTKAGQRAALEVIRHHRLIEAWLVQTLGYSWDEVHDEAERLEHVISEDFEMRIAAAMGNPERDPHGELIPTSDLTMPADPSVPLSSLRAGQKAILRQVRDTRPELLRHLESLGLLIGRPLEVLDFSPFDGNLQLKIGEDREPVVIGPAISNRIFVEIY